MTSRPQRQPLRSRHPTIAPRAFTLIELIVVMAIIVLVLSVLLPVANTLLGNRNIENTQNQIAGYIATARADAIAYRTPIGVCFFIDPATYQETLVEVQPIALPDWGNNRISQIWNNGYFSTEFTPIDIAGNRVVDTPTTGTLTAYRDALVLPPGVGVALVASPITGYEVLTDYPPGHTTVGLDQLVRLGIIMFDDTGTRMSMPYAIPGQIPATATTPLQTTVPIANALAAKLQLNNFCLVTQSINVMISCSAFYIYDHDVYSGQTTSSGRQFQDCDFFTQNYQWPSWTTYFPSSDKVDEDNWIIANGVELTVDPHDGSLLKAK